MCQDSLLASVWVKCLPRSRAGRTILDLGFWGPEPRGKLGECVMHSPGLGLAVPLISWR